MTGSWPGLQTLLGEMVDKLAGEKVWDGLGEVARLVVEERWDRLHHLGKNWLVRKTNFHQQ